MLAFIMVVACVLAMVFQTAVLRDRTIVEMELIEALRMVRIAAYGIAAVSGSYLWVTDFWLQPMFALSVTMLAVVDIAGAGARLWPEVLTGRRGGGDRV